MNYYVFTIEDIARVSGLTERKVRTDIKRGVFDPTDLGSVAAYVVAERMSPVLKEKGLI